MLPVKGEPYGLLEKYLSAFTYLAVAAHKFSAFATLIYAGRPASSKSTVPAGEHRAKIGESLPFIYSFQEVMPERVKR